MKSHLFGIDELRRATSWLNASNETLNQTFSAEQLLKLYRAHAACGWDFFLDQWTERQRADVLNRGRTPTWNNFEEPTYEP